VVSRLVGDLGELPDWPVNTLSQQFRADHWACHANRRGC
jgi:hypothetical protein